MSSTQPDTVPVLDVDDSSGQRTVPLIQDVTSVGRGAESDVQILNSHVSKRHAEIRRKDDRFVLVDVGSKAGVYCHGAAVRERQLVDGDVITLGPSCPTRLHFRVGSGSKARKASEVSSLISSFSETRGVQGLQQLSRFLGFSRALSGRLGAAEILENVVDYAIEVTGADRGCVVLKGDQSQLEFEAVRGNESGAVSASSAQVSETIVRQVLEEKAPRIVSDVAMDDDLAVAKSVMSLRLGSVVAMPLWRFALPDPDDPHAQATDDVFGVLYLDSRHRHRAFDSVDIGILETLARDASSAIENARLLGEAEEKRKFEQELGMAREIQASLLPEEYWDTSYCEVSGSCVPCLDLGGDYADQFRLSDSRVGLVVADVCGKGMPAALLAAAVQGALAAEFDRDRPLSEIVEQINRVVCRLAPGDKFISMICCVLSPDGELRYVNAGHCPLLVAGKEDVESLVTGGMALGFDESARYEEHRLQMSPGDLAVLYSDGVLETVDPDRELFGEKRLEASLQLLSGRSAEDVSDGVLAALESFRRGEPVTDDLTLMVLRYRGETDDA